jgi:hypothetical protein
VMRPLVGEGRRALKGHRVWRILLAPWTGAAEMTIAIPGSEEGDTPPEDYYLRISRLTIDKLGVKLYDKVSAAVAEVIANGYDADATDVHVEVPLGTELAKKDPATGKPIDNNYEIVVRDNGHGMTPAEAMEFYLRVGRDRRAHMDQGGRSRDLNRPVMGRKGIGKLAPFGICQRIEVISSGGAEIEGKGFETTHFFLDFDKIVADSDELVKLDRGNEDRTFKPTTGTTVRLTSFLPKRVPDSETLHRQIATRFALTSEKFTIYLKDTRQAPPVDTTVENFQIPVNETTRIDVAHEPVIVEEESLPVTGWLASAKEAYKNEELAGVRIYARGKIVATTRDFEQPAGYTGEYTMRSYLVGEVHADWLDDDDGEDLIRTDRQSILWDSDRGKALQSWGATLIKRIGAASKGPRRETKSALFMQLAKIEARATERYGDAEVVKVAVELARQIGAFAAEDELADPDYVDGLAEIVLTVAPHQALVAAFQQISRQEDASIEDLIVLFGKTRVAEMASYGQIAAERVQSIRELEDTIKKPGVVEGDLQQVIASAPWLIRPDWSVITQNQGLKAFRSQFIQFWKKKHGADIDVAISYEKKRPDFTAIHHGRKLHIVEIKCPSHQFGRDDYLRLQNYVAAFEEFFEQNKGTASEFPDGWQIDLIADGVKLTVLEQQYAFGAFLTSGLVVRQTWNDFLTNASTAHEHFLDAYDQARAAEEA